MVTGVAPRRSVYPAFTSIIQEKITVHLFCAACFGCFLLIFSATLFSFRNKDVSYNGFNQERVQESKRPIEPSPLKEHEPLRKIDEAEGRKKAQVEGALSETVERAAEPKRVEAEGARSEKVEGAAELKKARSGKVEGAAELKKVEELKDRLKRSDQAIADFWKNLTAAPRVVQQCANVSCRRHQAGRKEASANSTCPVYFRWIYEDLAPWMEVGISRALINRAKEFASFRVIIKDGRLFVEPYHPCYQTRSLFTIWGLLQLLKYYPGLVPDVDLMFSCEDRPVMDKKARGIPAPVYRYCSTRNHWDIPFPDWSFWGWSEINVAPWEQELSSIVKASKKTKWTERIPTAYWKGNPHVASLRQELLKCNSSGYGADIYSQDWIREGRRGFTNSKLADQCKHRYKIYVEGWGWSVSFKYILACDSPSLVISPAFHDFYSRGLVPRVSYWPVRYKTMCESIKFAVEWGNSNPAKAERIGKAGQEFMAKQVSMEHVYDYMLHLLTQYAKLLRFKPSAAAMEAGRELCSEEVMCSAQPVEKRFMEQSRVASAKVSSAPCTLPARDQGAIQKLFLDQRRRIRQIESREDASIARH